MRNAWRGSALHLGVLALTQMHSVFHVENGDSCVGFEPSKPYGLSIGAAVTLLTVALRIAARLAAFAANLRHMLTITRDCLPAFPADAGHVLAVLRYLTAAFAAGDGM